jgi:hypothetical protein
MRSGRSQTRLGRGAGAAASSCQSLASLNRSHLQRARRGQPTPMGRAVKNPNWDVSSGFLTPRVRFQVRGVGTAPGFLSQPRLRRSCAQELLQSARDGPANSSRNGALSPAAGSAASSLRNCWRHHPRGPAGRRFNVYDDHKRSGCRPDRVTGQGAARLSPSPRPRGGSGHPGGLCPAGTLKGDRRRPI